MFQPFTSRIRKKNKSSPPVVIPSPLAYAHCATGEAKAKSTGAAYEEVKVAKDQLNMAFVETTPFRIVLQLQFFLTRTWLLMISFCKIKECDNICFKVSRSQNDLNPIRQKSAFLQSKHQLVGLEVWSASLHLRGNPFQGPFPSLHWFLENMTENPNWNSNSMCCWVHQLPICWGWSGTTFNDGNPYNGYINPVLG